MKNLTKKVGPLPLWAYAVILGGAFLAYRMLRGGNKSDGGDGTVQLIPTGAPPIDASAGFLNELSMRLDRIESNQTTPPISTPPVQTAPPPASTDKTSDGTIQPVAVAKVPYEALTETLLAARARLPALQAAWVKMTGLVPGIPGAYPNETREQREARLRSQLSFYESGSLPTVSAKSLYAS